MPNEHHLFPSLQQPVLLQRVPQVSYHCANREVFRQTDLAFAVATLVNSEHVPLAFRRFDERCPRVPLVACYNIR